MLQSINQLYGETLRASDSEIGHVKDFYFDDHSWAVRRLVVKTGHWFLGKEVLISLSKIDGISYEESKVFMNLTKDAIRQAPEYYVPPVGAEDHHTRDFRD